MVTHSRNVFQNHWLTRRWLITLLLSAVIVGAHPLTSHAEGPVVELFDSMAFDYKLSRLMADQQPVITVTTIAPFTVNNIPQRIDKWLSSVSEHGGEVELKIDPEYPPTRDFGLVFDLIKKVFDFAKEVFIYKNAENYNVDVLYKPATGEVTRFVFTLKRNVESE